MLYGSEDEYGEGQVGSDAVGKNSQLITNIFSIKATRGGDEDLRDTIQDKEIREMFVNSYKNIFEFNQETTQNCLENVVASMNISPPKSYTFSDVNDWISQNRIKVIQLNVIKELSEIRTKE